MKRVFYLAMAFALGCGSVSALAEEADPGYEAVAITKVYGDGQKVAAVALQYGEEIDADSVEVADYQVTDYEITDVYVNSEAALTDENQGGCYVIVLLDTSELSDDYNVDMSISPQGHEGGNTAPSEREASAEEDEEESSEEDGEAFSGEDAEEHSYPVSDISSSNGLSNQLSVSITQVGDVSSVSGTVYEGSDTAIETDYQENINLVVDEFEQDVYTSPDDENSTLMYNLYLPEGYSDEAEYPLVLFMPDASADSSDPVKTLTQGLGAVIWAEEENQTENPCIVLAPQYKNDTDSVENTMGLLAQIVETYSVDESRIYLAGQSAGTIRAITLMIENPDTFAAALLVTGHADDDYEERLSELSGQNIWMIASDSEGNGSLVGMTAIAEAVTAEGTSVSYGAWSATLSEEEQNVLADAMIEEGCTVNFTVLSDVVPEEALFNSANEHSNTWRVGFSISEIRNWIFSNTKSGEASSTQTSDEEDETEAAAEAGQETAEVTPEEAAGNTFLYPQFISSQGFTKTWQLTFNEDGTGSLFEPNNFRGDTTYAMEWSYADGVYTIQLTGTSIDIIADFVNDAYSFTAVLAEDGTFTPTSGN